MRALLPWLLFAAAGAHAEWRFAPPVEVSPARTGVFHHLDAAGRQALAVAGGRVALAWEDNRDGAPRCRLAIKADPGGFKETAFGAGECFEPAVAAMDADGFLLIWEDAGGVRAARAQGGAIGPAASLASLGGQGSIARHPQLGIHAAWSASDGPRRHIWHARLDPAGGALHPALPRPVDPEPPQDDQQYPALAATPGGLALAWEDRRHGHTVIHHSQSRDGAAWSAPARLSRNPTGRAQGSLGRGSGAMRPALAGFGGQLAAAWLDKRDFLSGYDVYAAVGTEAGFGADAKAQDSFGDAIAQWHAAVAGNDRGEIVIAWDDDRDGTADIWLTWPKPGGGYADNQAAAAGPAHQSDPAIALDAAGRLHLAWIERGADGATRLMYALGEWVSNE